MNKSVVIVTRAQPGAAETFARAQAVGFDVISSPMLVIVDDPDVVLDLDGVEHLALTSANGVRAFVARSGRRDFTAWCVGPATREAAHKAGFAEVREGAGDAADLAALILATPSVEGRVLHVANAAAAGNFVQALKEGGVHVDFVPLYRAKAADALSVDAAAWIGSGGAGFVLVHSAKGAEAFLAAASGLDLSKLVAVAVSPKAGAPMEGSGLRAIVHAARPNEDGMFTALEAAVLAF